MKPRVAVVTERQRFEHWAKRNGHRHTLDRFWELRGAPYLCPETRSAWKAWQAAKREAKRTAKGGAA